MFPVNIIWYMLLYKGRVDVFLNPITKMSDHDSQAQFDKEYYVVWLLEVV